MESLQKSISIKNDLHELERVSRFFEQFIKTHQLLVEVSNPISLALDEILNNIITYGYSDEKEHEINIQINMFKEKIQLQIQDDALPFNPLELAESDTKSNLENRAIGGLGIHLIRKLMDKMHYEYKNKKNCLTLEKNFKEK